MQGLAGYLVPVMLLLCGILLWFNPAQRTFYSLLAIVLALASWVTSNLGGFFLGMMLGLVGGALAFAWTTASDRQPLSWFGGYAKILQPSWGVEVIVRPAAGLPLPGHAEGSFTGRLGGSAGYFLDSAARPGPDDLAMGIAEASGHASLSRPHPLLILPATEIVSDANDASGEEPATTNPSSKGTLGPVTGGDSVTGAQQAMPGPPTGSEILPDASAAQNDANGRGHRGRDGPGGAR